MRSGPRWISLLLPLFALASIALQAQQPMIAGRVVRADNGAPISGATVKLYVWFLDFRPNSLMGQPTPAAIATTDSSDEYRIEKVWNGTYRISVTVDGFLPNPPPADWQQDPPRLLTVFASHPLHDVNVSLARESAIRGAVQDTAGKLVGAGVSVTLVLPNQPNQPATSARTDAQGRFALEHLPSGSYLLCVNGPNGFGAPVPYANQIKPGADIIGLYQETWYGGAPSAQGARQITLAPGEERNDISINVRPESLHNVTVHVSGPGASPAEHYRVTLFRGGSGLGPEAAAGGTYRFHNVPCGPYSIDTYAWSGPENAPPSGPSQPGAPAVYLGRMREQFEVSDADVTLDLHVPSYATVQGIIHVSSAKTIPWNLRTSLIPLDPRILFPQDLWLRGQVTFDDAGNFSETVTPGKYFVGGVAVPHGAVLEGASCNGVKVSETAPLIVGDGQQIKGCEVTLTSKDPVAPSTSEPQPNPSVEIDPSLAGFWEMPVGRDAIGIRVNEDDRPQVNPTTIQVTPYHRTESLPERPGYFEFSTSLHGGARWDGHHLIIDRAGDGKSIEEVHIDLVWDKATRSWTGSFQLANDRSQVVLKRPSAPTDTLGNGFVGTWRAGDGIMTLMTCLHIVQQPDGIIAAWADYLQPSQRSYGNPLALQQINPTQVLVDVDAFAVAISMQTPPFTLTLSPDGQQLTGSSHWGRKLDRTPGDSCAALQ
jgi:hypothetical protein